MVPYMDVVSGLRAAVGWAPFDGYILIYLMSNSTILGNNSGGRRGKKKNTGKCRLRYTNAMGAGTMRKQCRCGS